MDKLKGGITPKKLSLDILFDKESKPPENRVPIGTIVSCEDCVWSGPIEDCLIEGESEGWEYSSYEIITCPECGGGIDI
jgi:hypothetical protein